MAAQGLRATATPSVATLNLADMMFVRGISAPIAMSKESVSLAPIRGKLAGGDVAGDVKVDLKGFRFTTSLDVKGAAVETMLQEAGIRSRGLRTTQDQGLLRGLGRLAHDHGRGPGRGRADCKVKDAKVLLLLSRVLVSRAGQPRLRAVPGRYRLAASRLHTPRLLLTGQQIQLTGQGTVNLDASTLDYDMTLALGQPLS